LLWLSCITWRLTYISNAYFYDELFLLANHISHILAHVYCTLKHTAVRVYILNR